MFLFRKKKERKDHKLSPFIILRATKQDYCPILDLMYKSFYKEDPTYHQLGITQNAVMDETAMKNMAEGITLVARCKNDGCIVGACINETTNKWDPDLKEKLAASVQCPNVRQLLLFQAHIQRFPNLWECYGTKKVFEITNMFVKIGYKSTDIAERLLNESRELAADCGYKIVRFNATSYSMANLATRQHMVLAGEMPYRLYLGRDLNPVIDPPYPNESVKVFVDVDPQIKKTTTKK
ncbi:hypothetical protein JTB14_025506 [Gonioctena quinquepunctata]|nr:hypothetical protein JTB14_025506 [Gonioctena quinquepunctata]